MDELCAKKSSNRNIIKVNLVHGSCNFSLMKKNRQKVTNYTFTRF